MIPPDTAGGHGCVTDKCILKKHSKATAVFILLKAMVMYSYTIVSMVDLKIAYNWSTEMAPLA